MPMLSKPTSAAYTALIYITVGALMVVWSVTWCVYLRQHPGAREVVWYICIGTMLTGAAILCIGLALGRIGREARKAELPPPEVTAAVANATQQAAARAPLVAPVNTAAPQGMMPQTGQVPGQVMVPPVMPGQPLPNFNPSNPSPPQV